MTDAQVHGTRLPLPGPIGRVASRAYLWELGRRNRRFDRGVGVETLAVPVVSVGNLSVGGTGKTPMVRLVCAWLMEAGATPCIAMRGYRAGADGSDEARAYQEELDGVAVVAQPDRAAGVRALMERGTRVDAVVLDDGFQHRRLARQVDIVLLDATRDPFADRALPAGWLRELPGALGRAHAVVVTHAEQAGKGVVDAMIGAALSVNPGLVVAVAEHAWAGLGLVRTGEADGRAPVDWLRGRLAVAVCAIGNPGAFLEQAERAIGGPVAGRVVLRDHAEYDERAVRRIVAALERSGADVVLTTGKDLVKLRRQAGTLGVPIAAVDLRMVLTRGEAELRALVLGCLRA